LCIAGQVRPFFRPRDHPLLPDPPIGLSEIAVFLHIPPGHLDNCQQCFEFTIDDFVFRRRRCCNTFCNSDLDRKYFGRRRLQRVSELDFRRAVHKIHFSAWRKHHFHRQFRSLGADVLLRCDRGRFQQRGEPLFQPGDSCNPLIRESGGEFYPDASSLNLSELKARVKRPPTPVPLPH
jgi:hypothetical protein